MDESRKYLKCPECARVREVVTIPDVLAKTIHDKVEDGLDFDEPTIGGRARRTKYVRIALAVSDALGPVGMRKARGKPTE